MERERNYNWREVDRAVDKAVAVEREACAKLAADHERRTFRHPEGPDGRMIALIAMPTTPIADAIRARQ